MVSGSESKDKLGHTLFTNFEVEKTKKKKENSLIMNESSRQITKSLWTWRPEKLYPNKEFVEDTITF